MSIELKPMYSGIVNSPIGELVNSITATDTEITVSDVTFLPSPPNLMTIGLSPSAETVLYTEIDTVGSKIKGVTRGHEGEAKAWPATTVYARVPTNGDQQTIQDNIEILNQGKADMTSIGGIGFPMDYTFNTATTEPLPQTGSQMRGDNTDQTLFRKIYLNNITLGGFDIGNLMHLIEEGMELFVQDKDESARRQRYYVEDSAIQKTDYIEIPVTWESGGTPLLGQRVTVFLSATQSTNDKGYFANPTELTTKYPTGKPGWFGTVGTTDTTWIWEPTELQWKDSTANKVSKAGDTMTGALAGPEPTLPAHYTTKAYVDAVAMGMDPKQSCRVATTANITLSGLQVIDGVTLAVGNRVLVKDQTNGAQNGIYIAATGAWIRSEDANLSAEVTSGLFTFIAEGTLNKSNGWALITPDPIILDTTSLVFTQTTGAGQITPGTGLAKNGNTIYITNTGVGVGTYTKLTVNAQGQVTSATTLVASDIPALDWAKITTGKPTTIAGYGITDVATGATKTTASNLNGYIKINGVDTIVYNDPAKTQIYGVKIDKNNPDPKSAVEYTDDAIGTTPATMGIIGQWDNLFPYNNIRRVMLKNGLPNYYFKTGSKTLKEDGTLADITTGADGDVMIELPLVYCKFWEDDNYEYRKISTNQIDDTWIPIAHLRGNEIRNKVYTGAYKGWVDASGKLRSLSGVVPSTSEVSMHLTKARTSAQLNGVGYDAQMYQITQLIQTLYLIKYKDRNSQATIGMGYVSDTWDGTKKAKSTGATNNRPIDWGEQTGLQQMCLFGIEDFWGNVWEWNEGIIKKTDNKIYLANTGFNDNGNNYTYATTVSTQGYINKTTKGFLPAQTTGASNTYYCDHFWFAAGALTAGLFGGNWNTGANVGCFCLTLSTAPAYVNVNVGARLCFS